MNATSRQAGSLRLSPSRGSALRPVLLAAGIGLFGAGQMETARASDACAAPGCPGAPYLDMPEIAPIGPRTGKYLEIPESSKGPAIEPIAFWL